MAPAALVVTHQPSRGFRPLRAAALALALGSSLVGPAAAAPAGKGAKPAGGVATYTMTVLTSSGMGPASMGAGSILSMMAGGSPSFATSTTRQLELRLWSPGQNPAPTAEHRIPAGLSMGPSLPLQSTPDQPGQPGALKPDEMPEAKGRLLIFRGCAESAGAGQPEILSMQSLLPDQRRLVMQNLKSMAALGAGNSVLGTTGIWPPNGEQNAGSVPTVPPQASLVGDHRVVGNYGPEIAFPLTASHDFMAAVTLNAQAAGAAQRLSWQPVPTALGYQAMVTGAGHDSGDIVIWTSSEAPWAESHVPPDLKASEAARLIQRKVLLGPGQTSCAVSAQAMAAMPMAMLVFTAYGEGLSLSSPKPASPWRLSLERRSTVTRPLGAGMDMLNPASGSSGSGEATPPNKRRSFNPFSLF